MNNLEPNSGSQIASSREKDWKNRFSNSVQSEPATSECYGISNKRLVEVKLCISRFAYPKMHTKAVKQNNTYTEIGHPAKSR